MRLTNLTEERGSNRHRISATVEWEDSDRIAREVFFETTPEFADDLCCDPHAFLLVGSVRAMRHGERRVAIDAEICPVMHDGLVSAMSLLDSWYPGGSIPTIEARQQGNPEPRRPRAASMLSGGIDSLATVRVNRMRYPRDHDWSIRDCFAIYGFDLGNQFPDYAARYDANFSKQQGIFVRRLAGLREIAEECEVDLIPVYTNTQSLCDDLGSLAGRYHSADLAAVAYAFSRRVSITSISSSTSIDRLFPYGSHPLLDPLYSSASMRIVHADQTLTRLEKSRLVADWDFALQHLRVCNGWKEDPHSPLLNCGKCEKCLRTMTALVAFDKLAGTPAFGANDVSEDMLLEGVALHRHDQLADWRALIEPLEVRGRRDLVRAIERIIRRYRWRNAPPAVNKVRSVAGRLRSHLGR
ncbi:MAG: hypothetical protein ACNA7W_01730 [Pseudomonadales bacterium]